MIIGIAGRMEAGKTSLARHLTTLIKNCNITPFAGALKFEVKIALDDKAYPEDITMPNAVAQAFGNIAKRSPVTRWMDVYGKPTNSDARTLLQWWGTDYRRRQDPNYWIEQYGQIYREYIKDDSHTSLCDDVRFSNELEYISRLGGLNLWLERTTDNAKTHSSEHSIGPKDCDFAFDSNVDLQVMLKSVTDKLLPLLDDEDLI